MLCLLVRQEGSMPIPYDHDDESSLTVKRQKHQLKIICFCNMTKPHLRSNNMEKSLVDDNACNKVEHSGIGTEEDVSIPHPWTADVDDVHAKLKHLVEMCQRERTLCGYELHDGIIQYLAGASMMQEKALQLIRARECDSACEVLTKSLALVRTAVEEARRMINHRRPKALEQLGLIAALRQQVADGQERYGVECTFVEDGSFTGVSAPMETTIFRIAQEAISNALRHSQSRAVLVSIAQHANRLCLNVEDWGVGFDLESIGAKGLGLDGIRYRADLVGGQVKIRSSPGKGTLIKVQLPVLETK